MAGASFVQATTALISTKDGAIPNAVGIATRSKSRLAANTSFWKGSPNGFERSAERRLVSRRGRRPLVTAIAEPPTKLESPASTETSEQAKFDWSRQWYPVAIVKDLDKDQPLAITVIGRPLAVWWDKSTSKWQVYADKCPHRMAPLSQGSITEDGQLRCTYHGWTFKGDSGQCTTIPQAPSDTMPLAVKNACATVYPSIEQQGLIWFWPDLSQGAINIEAAANPPPFFPELSDPTYAFDMSVRDVDCGYDILMEHILDPAHIAFVHHKVQGRREDGGPYSLKIESEITPAGYNGSMLFGFPINYIAPCTVTAKLTFPPEISPQMTILGEHSENLLTKALFVFLTSLKARFSKEPTPNNIGGVVLCIPVSPGRSRCIVSFARNFATSTIHITPTWMLHRTTQKIFDNDALILHEQGKRLQNAGENIYYTPTEADTLVLGFRKWYNDIAGGAPNWGGHIASNELPPSPNKRTLLDRYENHVSKCKGCRTALRRFNALELGLEILALALVGVVTASAAAPLPDLRPFAVPLVCAAVVSALLARWLSHFVNETFYFQDHNHAAAK